MGVADDDNMINLQFRHGKLQCRAGAVVMPILFIGRHQGRHVADSKYVAGLSLQNNCGINPRI